MTETKHIPSLLEARELIPEGRQPYIITRWALRSDKDIQNSAASAIARLADATRDGSLEPPLSYELAESVLSLDSLIIRLDDVPSRVKEPLPEFDYIIAKYVLEAVFEHAYRSDGV